MDLENEFLSILKQYNLNDQIKVYENASPEQKQMLLQQYAAQKQAEAANNTGDVFRNIALGILTGGLYNAIGTPLEVQNKNNNIATNMATTTAAAQEALKNQEPAQNEITKSTMNATDIANQFANTQKEAATTKALNAGVSKARAGLMGSLGNNVQTGTAQMQNTLANQYQNAANDLKIKQGDVNKLRQEAGNTNIAEWLGALGGLLTSDENEKVAPQEPSDEDIIKRVYHIFQMKEQLDKRRNK